MHDHPPSRADLVQATQRYLGALGARDPAAAALSTAVRMTENGVPVSLAGSVFSCARPLRYAQVFADALTGESAVFGAYEDDAGPVLYAARLQHRDGLVVEVEAMVNREGAHTFFAPQALTAPREAFDSVLPPASRLPRDRLRAIADIYFDAIELNDGAAVPFHADCMRIENGIRTTDNPAGNLPRSCRSGMQIFTYISRVRDRTYPVIDEERGVVFAWAMFDIPGTATTAVVDGQVVELPERVRQPRSMRIAEAFRIVDGQIHTIEAFIRYAQLGATTGWLL